MVHSSEIRTSFTARLKKALADHGVAEWGAGARLAKATGKTPKAASKWLNAEAIPARPAMIQIANWLEVDVDWLEYGPAESPAGPRYSEAGRKAAVRPGLGVAEEPRASYGDHERGTIGNLRQAWGKMDDQERERAARALLGPGKNLREIMELFFEINDASKSGALTPDEVGAIGTLVRNRNK